MTSLNPKLLLGSFELYPSLPPKPVLTCIVIEHNTIEYLGPGSRLEGYSCVSCLRYPYKGDLIMLTDEAALIGVVCCEIGVACSAHNFSICLLAIM
jgi:hypothetical protein